MEDATKRDKSLDLGFKKWEPLCLMACSIQKIAVSIGVFCWSLIFRETSFMLLAYLQQQNTK